MKLKFCKTVAACLALAMALSFASCGEKPKDNESDLSSSIVSTETSSESKAETSSKDETSSKNETSSKAEEPEISSENASTSSKVNVIRPNNNKTSSGSSVDNSKYRLDYTFRNSKYKDEFFVRDGIYNTLYKLQKGEDITIGYIGGSITQMKGYRDFTTEYFENNYEGKVKEVDIALAGTNADLGVCRVDDEILVHKPDLVFIEYASNGGDAKHVEGLVLKIWKNDPTTDIVFLYTSATNYYSTHYSQGKLPPFVEMSEKIADYYKIPSVYFGKQAFDMYEAGQLVLNGSPEPMKILYTTDKTHPTEQGHLLGAGAIARSVVNMEKGFDKSGYSIKKHSVPAKTYDKSPWVNAAQSDNWSKIKFSGEWIHCPLDQNGIYQNFGYSVTASHILKTVKELYGTRTPGASVTVKFRGTDIGIVELGSSFSGQLKVTVDGVDKGVLEIYDKVYDKELRVEYFFIDSLPYGEHTVTFTLDSAMPDKSALQAQRPNDKNFEKKEFYLNRILVNGELLDAH